MPHPSDDRRQHRPGSRLIYSLLSAIVPGTGQLLAGYRWRGGVMIGVTVPIIAGGLFVWAQDMTTLFSYLVQPRVLIGVFIINALVFLFRFGSVVDAYWSPRPGSDRRPGGWRGGLVGLALASMLVFTAAPHAVLGYYTYLTYDTLNQVFSVQEIADDLEEEQQSSQAEPAETSAPTPRPSPTPTAESQSDARTSTQSGAHPDALADAPDSHRHTFPVSRRVMPVDPRSPIPDLFP